MTLFDVTAPSSQYVTRSDVVEDVAPQRERARDERCDENDERRGCAHALRVLSRLVPPASGRRIAAVVACVLAVAILLPVGARAVSSRWHDDSLWANSLRSLGGLEVPFDFAIFLKAADDVRSGESPYVDPETVSEDAPGAVRLPAAPRDRPHPCDRAPRRVGGSSPVGVLVSLLLVACVVGALLVLDVRDWRCYPVALLYPPTLENIEYGAVGPVLALLVALAWRYRDRVVAASAALGGAVVLKVFLWPLLVWLAATRRWTAASGPRALALGLALASWAVIGFRGLGDYPELLRRLSDVEAENSYSAFAVLVALGLPATLARVLVVLAAAALLVLAWRVARGSRRRRRRRPACVRARARRRFRPHADPLAPLPRAARRPDRARAAAALGALVRAARAHRVRGARLVSRLAARGRPRARERRVVAALVFAISASPRARGRT